MRKTVHNLSVTTSTPVAPVAWRGDVRVGPLASIPQLLREAGVDPLPVLAGYGLAPATFDDADNRIDFNSASQLIDDCARLTGRQAGAHGGCPELANPHCRRLARALTCNARAALHGLALAGC